MVAQWRTRQRTPDGGVTDLHPLDAEVGDDFCLWLAAVLPDYFRARMAPHHDQFWRWVWAIEKGSRPDPLVKILARGGAKSTGAEGATVAVGARGTRRYGLYICGTQDRADDHVATISEMLESERVSILYPELAEKKLGKHGNSKGWRRNRLWTASGFVVDAIGLDVASRGVKLGEDRPDWLVLDEIDGRHDSAVTTQKKIETLTEGIIPAGSADVATLAVQNLVHRDSVFAQLADGRAEFLRRRTVIGPIPALRDFRVDPDGTIQGTPTWEGQNLDTCRAQADDWGLRAFRREAQHEVQEAEGALWSRPQIGAMRRDVPEVGWKKGVVMIDPSGGDGPDNDECGIVAACRGFDDHGYITHDLSGRWAPDTWGRLAVQAAVDTGYMRVGAERNYGGAMVAANVQTAKEALTREGEPRAAMVQFVEVHASTGKRQRAEPVASLCGEPNDETSWLRSRIHFVNDFPVLEGELTGWVPDLTKTSPNRLDAFVWSIHDLFPELMGNAVPRIGVTAARRRHGSLTG